MRTALDLSAKTRQFLIQLLVAPVKMINPAHHGFALRSQSRKHQAGAGTQVGGHDLCAAQATALTAHHGHL